MTRRYSEDEVVICNRGHLVWGEEQLRAVTQSGRARRMRITRGVPCTCYDARLRELVREIQADIRAEDAEWDNEVPS